MAKDKPDSEHWLVRPATIRKLWICLIILLVLSLVADFFSYLKPYVGIDGTFGFAAWFGFLSCVVLVLGSKALGMLLKRPDSYYDQ